MGKGKDFKKPKAKVFSQPSKTPKAETVPDSDHLHPCWRIAYLEMRDPFGWHELDRTKLDEIRERLRELERLTWKEILVDQNQWNHRVKASSLCKAAQSRLVELNVDDQTELVSLRLTLQERIWGFRLGQIMNLLWWDPTHDVWQD